MLLPAVLLLCGLAPAFAAGPYQLTRLESAGSIGPHINNRGWITGAYMDSLGNLQAAIWRGSQRTDIADLGGHRITGVAALNDSGRVAGEIIDGAASLPFLADEGSATSLAEVPGAYDYHINGLNNHGSVVGWFYVQDSPERAIQWQGGNALLLPPQGPGMISARAYGINDQGVVVGHTGDSEGHVACRWVNGELMPLGTLGGAYSRAYAVNEAGVIVGSSDTCPPDWGGPAMAQGNGRTCDNRLLPFRWENGAMTQLDTPPDGNAEALDINDDGLIVGKLFEPLSFDTRAVVWDGDGFHWLDELHNGDPGVELWSALEVNNRGEILCQGFDQGVFGHYLLRPIVERPPVLVLPGIAATYAADENDIGPWLFTRGIHPDGLQIDPLGHFYDDLLRTLDNAGYTPGEDLFAATYDWRVTPAPVDGVFDGVVSGLSAAAITDGGFEHGVDYLGHWLLQAMDAWEAAHPGDTLREVDLIAHSTGGLVARAYLQSAARGGLLPDGRRLPEVRKLVMVGVPNRGASKVWNPWHDNWGVDVSFQMVLSKMINLAFQKVLDGAVVTGPDGDIDLSSLLACGEDLKVCFLRAYVPTIHSLLATFPFLDTGAGFQDVNAIPELRNGLILDLNAGLDLQLNGDPNSFADHAQTTVIHATSEATPRLVVERLGEAGGEDALVSFDAFASRDALPGEVWYEDLIPSVAGDGTVPLISSMEQFVGDARVTLSPYTRNVNTQEDVSHCGMLFNTQVQEEILTILGAAFGPEDISTGLHAEFATTLSTATNIAANIVGGNLLSLVLDPVEGFLVDGQGRRLGWSAATGPVAEIPGSFWTGDGDGLGWQFGPLVEPLSLQLTGQGAEHYAQVSLATGWGQSGLDSSGPLAAGEPRNLALPFPPLAVPAVEIAWSGPGQAQLTWTPVPGAAGYRVEEAPAPQGPWTTLATSAATSAAVALPDDAARCLRVIAVR